MKVGDITPMRESRGRFRILEGQLSSSDNGAPVVVSSTPDGSELFVGCRDHPLIAAKVDTSQGDSRDAAEILDSLTRLGSETALFRIAAVLEKRRFLLEQFSYGRAVRFPEQDPLRLTVTEATMDSLKLSKEEMPKALRLLEEEFFLNGGGEEIGPGFGRKGINIETRHGDKVSVPTSAGSRIAFFTESPGAGAAGNLRLLSKNYYCDVHVEREGVRLCSGIQERHRGAGEEDASIILVRGALSFTDSFVPSSQIPVVLDNNYLRHWKLYEQLEEEWVRAQAAEIGSTEYQKATITRTNEGILFDFELKRPLTASMPLYQRMKDGLELEVSTEDIVGNPEEEEYRRVTRSASGTLLAAIPVGKTLSLPKSGSTARLRCILPEGALSPKELPSTGFLIPAVRGDLKRLQRQRIALENVRQGQSKLPTLPQLLDDGDARTMGIRPQQTAVTDTVNTVLLGRELTASQKEALDVALNTPDIALIQGPPGTGKTTVIRALIARLLENGVPMAGTRVAPRILVTSYQHDAVDNAIEGLDAGGLPVDRVGGKRGSVENEQDYILYDWVKKRKHWCEQKITRLSEPPARALAHELNRRLADTLQRTRLDLQSGTTVDISPLHALLLEAMNVAAFALPADLAREVSEWITHPTRTAASTTDKVDSGDTRTDGYEARLRKRWSALLGAQRTTPQAFADDGEEQAARLLRFWRDNGKDIGLEALVPDIVSEAATRPLHENEAAFGSWTEAIQGFQRAADPSYVSHDDTMTSSACRTGRGHGQSASDREAIALLRRIVQALLKYNRTGEGLVADVLASYTEDIQDLMQVRRMIKAYGEVLAGTCQQTAEAAGKEGFDVVIIDEAARATPLDLLIPMAQGKRIILVGDHLQLPHILEDDVRRKVVTDTAGGEEAAAFLEVSLFEHLFRSFQQAHLKGAPKRSVTLKQDFRMHPVISTFVSRWFYNETVEAGCRVSDREHTLGLYDNRPVAWIDIGRGRGSEQSGRSKTRTVEVQEAIRRAGEVLLRNSELTVGIITFYEKQAALLSQEADQFILPAHRERLRIGTVDAFQGRQFDVIFLSTVRSNDFREVGPDGLRRRVGFLALKNRLCVAFSRARRLLVVCGDADTIAGVPEREAVPILRQFVDLCRSQEGYYERL